MFGGDLNDIYLVFRTEEHISAVKTYHGVTLTNDDNVYDMFSIVHPEYQVTINYGINRVGEICVNEDMLSRPEHREKLDWLKEQARKGKRLTLEKMRQIVTDLYIPECVSDEDEDEEE